MPIIAYRDDNALLAPCFVRRDYAPLRERILAERDTLTDCLEEGGELFGFRVTRNNPVSALYGMEVRVVRFEFSRVSTAHDEHQLALLRTLCERLSGVMTGADAYFNVRLPLHILDLMTAFQQCCPPAFFCGGTMEYVQIGEQHRFPQDPGLSIRMADRDYCRVHRETLCRIAYESFDSYQGQYHIAPALQDKAALVYRNWIDGAFADYREDTVLVAELNGAPAGFLLLGQTETAVDALLGCVDASARKAGAFRALFRAANELAEHTGRVYVSSTQLDNFVSAGTMTSLGMRPFYGIYNYHFDHRGGN